MSQPGFSDAVVAKAHRLLADPGRLSQDEEHPAIWWITSSTKTARYRVQSDYNAETKTLTWVNCTCPHGLNKGAGTSRCYHVAAVLLRMREQGLLEEKEKEVEEQ